TAHSAIVHRTRAGDTTVRFEGDRWLRYVPLRLPWTQQVQERLPAGAAAVLLNSSHQHRDLIFLLAAQENGVVDAIDGRRTITEIVDHARGIARGRARTLFEMLWWYDQVVFDVSEAL